MLGLKLNHGGKRGPRVRIAGFKDRHDVVYPRGAWNVDIMYYRHPLQMLKPNLIKF